MLNDNQVTPILALRTRAEMSRKQFTEYFGIPYRTVQDWELDNRKCPEYLVELMEYKLTKENLIKTDMEKGK